MGCPPPALLVTVIMPKGMFCHADLFDEGFEFGDIHIALERMRIGGVIGFVNDQVGRASAARADVGVGGVEVHVRGDEVPRLDEARGQDVLGGASLMRGDKILEAENILHCVFQDEGTSAPRVRFVAAHDGGPLL